MLKIMCTKRFNALQNELKTLKTEQLQNELKLQQQKEINLSNVNALNQCNEYKMELSERYETLQKRYAEQTKKLEQCAQDNETYEQLLADNKRLKEDVKRLNRSNDGHIETIKQINETAVAKLEQIEAYSNVVVQALELLKTRRPGRVAKNTQAAIKLLTDFKANV
jgi:DNA repair exonuclease SbcCD ATPase subunit